MAHLLELLLAEEERVLTQPLSEETDVVRRLLPYARHEPYFSYLLAAGKVHALRKTVQTPDLPEEERNRLKKKLEAEEKVFSAKRNDVIEASLALAKKHGLEWNFYPTVWHYTIAFSQRIQSSVEQHSGDGLNALQEILVYVPSMVASRSS